MRISLEETALVDHPFVQRLRNIFSTGFSYLPFPGATHSRYAHSLGVMHLSGRAFDSAFEGWEFSNSDTRASFRSVVRLAALCHDLGHSPFSHCTEFAMPGLSELNLQWLETPDEDRIATHEDYTVGILQHASVAEVIGKNFGFSARHVAALICPEICVEDDFFMDGGLDFREVLSQIISSELDVDRMDYLVRDSYYSGARYGQIDVSWLVSNLEVFPHDGKVSLALDSKAIYAFDDFMIARHHMFLMVYFHHKSVVYEELLKRWVKSPDCNWTLPANMDEYLFWDDSSLQVHLRKSTSVWARRVVEMRPYRRILEVHGTPDEVDLTKEMNMLENKGIDYIAAGSTGKLSRYNIFGQKRDRAPLIYVIHRRGDMAKPEVTTLANATRIFQRYADARRLARLYVSESDEVAAGRLLQSR